MKYHVRMTETQIYDLLIEANSASEAESKSYDITLADLEWTEDGGRELISIKQLRDCTER